MYKSMRRRIIALSVAVAVLPILAACSSTAAAPKASPTSHGSLPTSALLSPGQLTIGINTTYPPFSYQASGKVTGLDVDLIDATSKQMGLKPVLSDTPFEGLITGLQAKRVDIVWSAFRDDPTKQAVFDFVDYLQGGMLLVVQKGNPAKVHELTDLCGKTVGVTTGSTPEITELTALSKQCATAGKQPVTVQQNQSDTSTLLALQQGRIVADFVGAGAAAYTAKTRPDDFATAGPLVKQGYYGVVVPKGNSALVKALESGVQAIIDNGTYGKILAKYGLSQIAVPHVGFNGKPLS